MSKPRREPVMTNQVKIFDTTLRDGEQLARRGVDIIEAGCPIASPGDFESVEAIAHSVRGPVITALSRTGFQDIDRAWAAVQHAEHPRIHVFIATSLIHMKKKLRMTEDQVKAEVC